MKSPWWFHEIPVSQLYCNNTFFAILSTHLLCFSVTVVDSSE